MIFIPFNHQPESTSVKTATYDIPAGKYARAQLFATDGAVTIDGVTAIAGFGPVGVSQTITAGNSYTITTGYVFRGTLYVGAAAGTSYINTAASLIGAADSRVHHVELHAGATINAVGGSVYVAGNEYQDINHVSTTEVWLDEGTEISGSGSWRAVVEIYSKYT